MNTLTAHFADRLASIEHEDRLRQSEELRRAAVQPRPGRTRTSRPVLIAAAAGGLLAVLGLSTASAAPQPVPVRPDVSTEIEATACVHRPAPSSRLAGNKWFRAV